MCLRMVLRSHLPFCDNVEVKKATNPAQNWYKYLSESIPKLTPPGVKEIIKVYPNWNSLMEAYERLGNESERERLLENIQVVETADGHQRKRSTRLGLALSWKVYRVMYGEDPNELVDQHHK